MQSLGFRSVGIVFALALIGCGGGGGGGTSPTPGGGEEGGGASGGGEGGAGGDTTARPTVPAIDGEVVRDWHRAVYEAAVVDGGYFNRLFFDDRAFTMVAIAQHDALNSIDPRYEAYAYKGSHPGADPTVAAAQAAYEVLTAAYPAQKATFDARLARWTGSASDAAGTSTGVEAGKGAAAAIIAARKDDGIDAQVDYKEGKPMGAWKFTPPAPIAVGAEMAKVRPFALTSADQFLPPAPPALDSKEYAEAFEEVKTVGAKKSKTRTPDQSDYGRFWYEFAAYGWGKIARAVSQSKKSDAWETARVFALTHMALFDAYVAGFLAKYHYAPTAGWRPITAIRMANKDPNKATKADPKWEPYLDTPPIPDYPSTHSALGGAAAVTLASVYGDETEFEFASTSFVKGAMPGFAPSKAGDPEGDKRSFKSFSQAATENADSRVIIGIHFRFATTAGLALGKSIGEWVVANKLRKR